MIPAEGLRTALGCVLLKPLFEFLMGIRMVRTMTFGWILEGSVSLPFPISVRTGNGQ